ncbi:aflatoxin B1 aldehyde reductase member 2 [Lasiosphaeria miniovina]|uniref:Aflatoxin B1 aldehyde reductase member 2 n=1 Tax=Lasiosphaeria miniovina TaxID=1954250 RepID=A0AA40ACV2_9PEZI|nr:aflatoxin B1 aldehyde reductase member 2 [Lasiosphaeria miniovina]KAK0713549.1 aflatoxin B1 aldehyde reductase member 2 [Lasiosphaeria miniovina]
MATKPRIILGLMTFGPDANTGARLTDINDLKTALDVFEKRGYKELDTARGYCNGQQEAFTRAAGYEARGLAIGTKVYPMPPGTHRPDVLTQQFETSLKELGTDCVDIAYLHAPDRSVPFADTLAAMDALHRAGKFKRLGLSNYAAYEVAEMALTCAARGWVRPSIYQAVYNVLQRGIEGELLAACRRYGLEVVVYSPTVAGLLAGAVRDAGAVPADGRFSDKFFGGMMRHTYFRDSTFAAVAAVRAAADAHGISAIEAGLRWLAHHSQLDFARRDGIVVGVSSLTHLDDNLAFLLDRGPLPEALVKALNKAWLIAKPETPAYWHFDLKYGYDAEEVLFGKGAK